MSLPALPDRFDSALAEAGDDIAKLRALEELAEAAKRYATSHEQRVRASVAKLEVARQGGAVLIRMAEHGERAGRGGDPMSRTGTLTLDGLGLSRNRSSRWQAIARLSDEEYADREQAILDESEDRSLGVKGERHALRRPGPLPAGKYHVIYADPPWRYEFAETDSRAVETQYPTLTADEIATLEDDDGRAVSDLAAEDSLLFLWATNPKLADALDVMAAWGFDYVTNAVWVKDRIGMGYWWRQRHELLLLGRRGEYPTPPQAARPDSVIEAPRGVHSAKPAVAYDLIEAMTPGALRVEVFRRGEPRPGWYGWGNQ